MELLKTLMSALSKNFNLKNNEKLSEVIRRKILETMLWMINTYRFCSTSNQLAVQIINFLREAFDEEDMDSLKQFVMTEIEGSAVFEYPSGRKTSGMSMCQIVQIAIELRDITQ